MENIESKEFIDKNFIYAIVGATQNHNKYGYKVFADLKKKGFQVLPVNPKYEEIDGVKCYPDLICLDDRPDVVVLVVGDKNSEKILKDCVELQLDRIWFQPGSEFASAVKIGERAGFKIMVGKCIMLETQDY